MTEHLTAGSTTTDLVDGLFRRDDDRVAVTFERRYATPVADLWTALTEPGRIARWLAPVTVDARVGGAYTLDFGEDQRTTGEVLACEPPALLRVSWLFEGEPPSEVEVRIVAEGAGSLLRLDHTRLPQAQAGGYGAGWHAHLEAFAAVAAGTATPDWDARFTAVLPAYRAALDAVV